MSTVITPDAPPQPPRERTAGQAPRRGLPREARERALRRIRGPDRRLRRYRRRAGVAVRPAALDYFGGLTGPALALGLVAVLSLGALYGLLTRRPAGSALSLAAGTVLVVFEVVESLVVGNLFCPPPGSAGDRDTCTLAPAALHRRRRGHGVAWWPCRTCHGLFDSWTCAACPRASLPEQQPACSSRSPWHWGARMGGRPPPRARRCGPASSPGARAPPMPGPSFPAPVTALTLPALLPPGSQGN